VLVLNGREPAFTGESSLSLLNYPSLTKIQDALSRFPNSPPPSCRPRRRGSRRRALQRHRPGNLPARFHRLPLRSDSGAHYYWISSHIYDNSYREIGGVPSLQPQTFIFSQLPWTVDLKRLLRSKVGHVQGHVFLSLSRGKKNARLMIAAKVGRRGPENRKLRTKQLARKQKNCGLSERMGFRGPGHLEHLRL